MTPSHERVYFLVNHPLWNGEAYAVRALSEADALRARDIPVGYIRVVATRAWRAPDRASQARQLREDGVRVIDCLQPPDFSRPVLRRFQTLVLRAILRRIMIAHRVHILHAEGIRAGSLAASAPPQTKVVLDVHGDVEAEARLAFDGTQAELRKRWAREDTRTALARADAVLSVSRQMTTWLQTEHAAQLGSSPVVEVPCGVDIDRFQPVTDSTVRFRVLYLGGLQAYQPPELIAEACRDLAGLIPDADFMVVTPGNHERVRQAFASHDLDVLVRGATPDEVPRLMHEADLGIVPRIDDQVNRVACPTKIGEYLAAGVPVACSTYVGGWASWLAERQVGFALQAPADEILAAVDEIRSNRIAMSQRCRAVAEEHWAWSRLGDRLASVYRGLGVS